MYVAVDNSTTGPYASRAQYWIRETMKLYRPGADMFCGDEDNGEMAAW
jgi:putative alpha-1,2-mannosidase